MQFSGLAGRSGRCLTWYSSLAVLMQSNFAGRRIGHPGERWHYALSAAAHASPHDAQEPVRVQSPIVIADKSNFSHTIPLHPSADQPIAPCFRHSQPRHRPSIICARTCIWTFIFAIVESARSSRLRVSPWLSHGCQSKIFFFLAHSHVRNAVWKTDN